MSPVREMVPLATRVSETDPRSFGMMFSGRESCAGWWVTEVTKEENGAGV
jgi:hypothetical protein